MKSALKDVAPPNFVSSRDKSHIQMEVIQQTLKQNFSSFNWFEEIQYKLICAALNCQQKQGVKVWAELLQIMHEKTQESIKVLKNQAAQDP